jgi:hypothetical protein
MDGVKVTVNVNGSALAAEHNMGDVGGAIAVSVSDSEDTSLVGSHRTCDLNFAAKPITIFASSSPYLVNRPSILYYSLL